MNRYKLRYKLFDEEKTFIVDANNEKEAYIILKEKIADRYKEQKENILKQMKAKEEGVTQTSGIIGRVDGFDDNAVALVNDDYLKLLQITQIK